MKNTEYITLTEMWQDEQYLEVVDIISTENWDHSTLVEFCAYFIKYLGLKEFSVFQRLV
tara:strand:+ start:40439 stop:40615 length:177 start_codon:yes stop_codon:yes gene_type:complete